MHLEPPYRTRNLDVNELEVLVVCPLSFSVFPSRQPASDQQTRAALSNQQHSRRLLKIFDTACIQDGVSEGLPSQVRYQASVTELCTPRMANLVALQLGCHDARLSEKVKWA